MAHPTQRAAKQGFVDARRLWAIRLLVALAFSIGAYLLIVSLRGINVVGCGPDSGCDKVLHSRWAYWFGLPVSLFAVAVYSTIFFSSFWLSGNSRAATQRKAWNLLLPCAVLVIGAGLWFCFLQAGIIKAICPFCMAAHGSGLLAALLVLWSAPFGPAPEKPWQREKQVYIPARLAQMLFLLAGCGVAILVAGQIVHQKKSFVIASLPVGESLSTNINPLLAKSNAAPGQAYPASNPMAFAKSAPQTPAASNSSALPPPAVIKPVPPNPYPGQFLVLYGTNVLDLKKVPIIGSASSPYLVVSLYDYTCHHCKLMHVPLLQLQRTFASQVALISLPMPLDPACNRTVKQASGVHTNGCALARVGLGVWRANPAKLPEFDDWMFTPETPPTPEAAKEHAAQLVGSAELERALQDPWIDQQILQAVTIYEVAYTAGQGSMPQIIIGRRLAVGTLPFPNLLDLVKEQFNLTVP